jgi:hypothetical protein
VVTGDWDADLPPDLYAIRLQGPWQWLNATGGATITVTLPLAEPLPGESIRLSRNFQRPTNLDREERVLLVMPIGARPQSVYLGTTSVPGPRWIGERAAWDLTQLLKPSNRLVLEFAGGPWRQALRDPVLIGVMPDFDGSWWESLPRVED